MSTKPVKWIGKHGFPKAIRKAAHKDGKTLPSIGYAEGASTDTPADSSEQKIGDICLFFCSDGSFDVYIKTGASTWTQVYGQ
jgi:hypothetical protein